ncbi:MAG: GtrA family protein [Fibrobacterales bacterium]
MRKVLNSEFVRFIVVGVINTLLFLIVARSLEFVNVHHNIANLSGYIVGGTNSYFMNKFWSFKTEKSHKEELPIFIVVFVVCYFLNLLILNVAMNTIELPTVWFKYVPRSIQGIITHTLICQAIANVFYTILSFTLYKTIVFRGPKKKS